MSKTSLGFGVLGVTAAVAFVSAGCGGQGRPKSGSRSNWSYDGTTGPTHWAQLEPDFGVCATGMRQSPIDLPAHLTRSSTRAPERPQYAPVPAAVVNNGHFVLVNDPAPSSFEFEGETYALLQFHFHTPSEHTIGGRRYDAELHLVHKAPDGKTLVIAVMFQRGKENEVLRPMWDAMPVTPRSRPSERPGVPIDAGMLLPAAPRYIRYDGSLTAPPCTEGVTWLVVEPDPDAPMTLSDAQIGRMRAVLHGPTARPVQPLNGREVYELVP